MATSAGLRTGFDYDLEYNTSGRGLDEFEPEDERPAFAVAGSRDEVEALSAFEGSGPSGRRRQLGMQIAAAALLVAAAVVVWLAMRQPAGAPATSAPLDLVPLAARGLTFQPAVAVSEGVIEAREAAPQGARRAADLRAPHAAPEPLRAAIDETLAGVSQAYRALDAAALAVVWPGADAAALSRQFSFLKYQSLSFDSCDVQAAGRDQAVASCAVSIAAAAKNGDPSLQQRRESWRIVLARKGDRYLITRVSTR